MLITFYDSYRILQKVYGEGAYLKQAMTETDIDEINRSAVTKICYGVLERDIFLSDRISRLCSKNPKLPVRILLKIAIYNITFLGKAVYAVTDATVELCNKLGKKGVSGFVNAVLRGYAAAEFPQPVDTVKSLSLKYDYPCFAVRDLLSNYGAERAESIMAADGEKTCLRFPENGREYLEDKKIEYINTPYENVFFVPRFRRNADYDKGIYTFQSIGSVAVAEAVGGGRNLFDACAAPGGKSVLLSMTFENVVSQEIHPHRVQLIREYAARMGRENITVVNGDASVFTKDYENAFDAVLCDVPCSGMGVLKTNPDIKLNKTEETVEKLNQIQFEILQNCSRYVALGGLLVYSTCSFLSSENDGVAGRFLTQNKAFTSEIISLKIPCEKTDFGVQLLPDISFGAGFYISAMRRVK